MVTQTDAVPAQPAVAAPTIAMPAKTARQDRPLRAIFYMNGAVLIFTGMDAIVKAISGAYPTGQIIFCRNFFAFLPILIFLWRSGGLSVKTKHPFGHILRGLFGVGSMYFYFLSYKLLPLSDAVALALSSPIFMTVLAIPLLGEKIGIRRWIAVAVGFVGVLIMTRPGVGVFQLAALIPLIATIFYDLAMVTIRKLNQERSGTVVFYFTSFACIAGLATIPIGRPELADIGLGPWVWPTGIDMGLLVVIGVMGGIGQILLTNAFLSAPIAVVAPFDYTALVYAMILGYLCFGEVPDAYLIIGGLTVVGSGIYIIHREAVAARERRRAGTTPALIGQQ
ncbi:DMT family transporter [Dongia soli]|uniref:DMT family transporter n=1 Tax=Dongia soli TaxID=600628 RepID=A0ABU5E7P8_9PROT|nr:DMT family transporter [Dongia soli]MDY0881917.1 DMT family transporter [Dongia soli]